MPYIPHTDEERRAMLDFLGLDSEEAFFDPIPEEFIIDEPLPVGEGRTEHETIGFFQKIAAKNHPAGGMISFLGGGIYDHVVPSIVDHIASRSEFSTAYTPYQAEVSQGTLQAIFEFQTLISRLTSLPVANASMYDGATALAEAALMAIKITSRDVILFPENLNPRYQRVLRTYLEGRDISMVPVPFGPSGEIDRAALGNALSERVAGVLLQTPNYFGVIERPWDFRADTEQAGSLLIASVDPVSLSVLTPPGKYGASIAVGEGQSLGNYMNFGGPLLGFMACKAELIRNMPGRIMSRTEDLDGKVAYVLTLQTREQHIRRERATSNICTNEGLLALRAAVYLALLGEHGFRELGRVCIQRAQHLADMIAKEPGFSLKFSSPFFREFVVECPEEAEKVVERARRQGILAGIPLGGLFGEWAKNCLLVAVTEKRSEEDLEKFCRILGRRT